MKLTLVHNQNMPKMRMDLLVNPNVFESLVEDYTEFDYLLGPLNGVMKSKLSENATIDDFENASLHFIHNPLSSDPNRIMRCNVQFQNAMLASLHKILNSNVDTSGNLNLIVTIKNPETGFTFEVTDFKPSILSFGGRGSLEDHSMYIHKDAMLPKDIISRSGICVSVLIDINIPNHYPFAPKAPKLPAAESAIIFHDKTIRRDVNIVTMEGSKVPCHWFYLVSHSNIFLSMLTFTAELGENNMYELELRGMSEKAVNALLEFIYLGKLTEAENDSKLALELLDAAELYKIDALLEAMKKMFKEKSNDWIGLEVTVKLYRFAKQFPELSDLLIRADFILWSKGRDDLEEYFKSNDLFEREFWKPLLRNMFGHKKSSKKPKVEVQVDAE